MTLFKKLKGWPFFKECFWCSGTGKENTETGARYGDEPFDCRFCEGTGYEPRYARALKHRDIVCVLTCALLLLSLLGMGLGICWFLVSVFLPGAWFLYGLGVAGVCVLAAQASIFVLRYAALPK